jgi:deoxyadenosine/deoxycytidine kinase
MLKKFYGDQEKYSFPFQMMAYISRLALLKAAIKEHPNAIIITERSLYTDKFVFAKMLYNMGKIEHVCYQIYSKWFDTFVDECPLHQVVYVHADPAVCHHRIAVRSRDGEEGIPLSYLSECHAYHEHMMKEELSASSVTQLVLDGNVDINENPSQLDIWTQKINEFVSVGASELDL